MVGHRGSLIPNDSKSPWNLVTCDVHFILQKGACWGKTAFFFTSWLIHAPISRVDIDGAKSSVVISCHYLSKQRFTLLHAVWLKAAFQDLVPGHSFLFQILNLFLRLPTNLNTEAWNDWTTLADSLRDNPGPPSLWLFGERYLLIGYQDIGNESIS